MKVLVIFSKSVWKITCFGDKLLIDVTNLSPCHMSYFTVMYIQIIYSWVVGCRYLLHYILSYAQNEDAYLKFGGLALVCLLVSLIGLGKFLNYHNFSSFRQLLYLFYLKPKTELMGFL